MKTKQRTARHTPGPWTATHCETTDFGLPRDIYAGALPIASIAGQAPGGPAVWVANALLLAAAPRLLSELQNLVACLEAVHAEFPQHYETTGCPDIAKHVAAARDTIAKAEGR